MTTIVQLVVLALAVLGFVGWLGGGRKWAFRTLLSALVLLAIGAAGVFLYGYTTSKAAERRAQKLHDCAVAKVANARCEKPVAGPNDPKPPKGWEVVEICPPELYAVGENASPKEETSAIELAEQECRGEMNPQERSLHEQLIQYRKDHPIQQGTVRITRMGSRDCAAKVRTFYPHAYDDVDDATLTRLVLAKYPTYCDITSTPPELVPDVRNIR